MDAFSTTMTRESMVRKANGWAQSVPVLSCAVSSAGVRQGLPAPRSLPRRGRVLPARGNAPGMDNTHHGMSGPTGQWFSVEIFGPLGRIMRWKRSGSRGVAPGWENTGPSARANGKDSFPHTNPGACRIRRCTLTLAVWVCVLLLLTLAGAAGAPLAAGTLPDVIDQAQTKIVKIYGAGGFRGLQAYQSGMLVSPDGHVLTVFSYVLDTDYITAVTHDGRRFDAKLLGADPRLEIALLKIDDTDLPYFNLSDAVAADPGTRVIALSNLFGVAMGNEPASVQRGTIAARSDLQARRGQFDTAYRGPVYILDATTNNPGAAGGALLTVRGELLGVLGKELRNAQNHTWLNYALPIAEIEASVAQIRAGVFAPAPDRPDVSKPELAYSLALLGIRLVPDVLDRTPPFVEYVREGSPAAKAGIRPDDLVLLLGDQLIQSCAALREELEHVDIDDEVRLTILRGDETPELSEVVLKADPENPTNLP